MKTTMTNICAIVLAAGQSKRMGQPKLILPWGNTTVIAHVVSTIYTSGIQDIFIVTGGAGDLVKDALAKFPVQFVENPRYKDLEMLSSLQLGIQAISGKYETLLIVLGDQPTIDQDVIIQICQSYYQNKANLIIPSHHLRRGHPWLVHRSLWQEILDMDTTMTLRDFLNNHNQEIYYVVIDNPGILSDLDTPEDYQKYQPGMPKAIN
jgi:molybdenum cofactor cytidylyltransferase